jgi:hypothetical protein
MSTRQDRVKHWLRIILAVTAWIVGMAPAAAEEDRQVFEAQAKRYWLAEVGQDYATVYGMLSTDEQNTITREDYVTLRKEGGPPRFVTAQVGDIDYDGNLAWVFVKFDWMLPRYAYAGSRPGTTWQLWRNAGGWHPIPLAVREQWPILPPQQRPAADEANLKARVSGLWQAKVEQDWKSVYTYMPPWFREQTPLDKYLKSKARFLYVAPEVQWVEAKDDKARAAIMVGTKYNDPAATKMQPIVDKVIEPWIKADGIWYLDALPADEPREPAKENVH